MFSGGDREKGAFGTNGLMLRYSNKNILLGVIRSYKLSEYFIMSHKMIYQYSKIRENVCAHNYIS